MAILLRRRAFVLALFLCVAVAAGAREYDDIKKACSHTPFPELCAKYLRMQPESESANPHQLGELALRSAIVLGMNISSYLGPTMMKVEAGDIKASAKERLCLNECGSRYYDSAANLDDSAWAIKEWEYGNVKEWTKTAKSGIKVCKADCDGVQLPDKVKFDMLIDDYLRLFHVILAMMEYLQLST